MHINTDPYVSIYVQDIDEGIDSDMHIQIQIQIFIEAPWEGFSASIQMVKRNKTKIKEYWIIVTAKYIYQKNKKY